MMPLGMQSGSRQNWAAHSKAELEGLRTATR
jgi:hypothetical protein